MKLNKKAMFWATVISLPIMFLGTYFWVLSLDSVMSPTSNYIANGIISYLIFLLGSPLTLIYFILMPYLDNFLVSTIGHNLWFLVLPLLNLLVWIQWNIWTHLFARIIRWLGKKTDEYIQN